jgi:hypothetical protein
MLPTLAKKTQPLLDLDGHPCAGALLIFSVYLQFDQMPAGESQVQQSNS